MIGTAILKTPEQIAKEKKGAAKARRVWNRQTDHTRSCLAHEAVLDGIDWDFFFFRDEIESETFPPGFKQEISRLIDELIEAHNYGLAY